MKAEKINLEAMRHSASHVMAAAVGKIFGEVKYGIGPTIENGFYYDFELPKQITPEDLPKIEKEMQEIIKQDLPIECKELPIKDALKLVREQKQPYKEELIAELKEKGEKSVTFYTIGDFTDLCRGPHVERTGQIGPFKLTSIAGAYWRGSEKNKMLVRIYGAAFPTQEELEDYLNKVAEMKKRDHRKVGKELNLYTFSELVGSGLPMFTPQGTFIRQALQEAVMEISKEYGYQPVTIPHIAKIKLYETSGHAQKFGDELFKVISHYGEEFVMKPVNCPHHIQIYASRPRSYRELPIRYIETTMQYRDEKPGEIGGLTRVRSITVDDGHLFCTMDQVKDEAKNLSAIIEKFYQGLGLWGNHWVSLSVRDPHDFSKYIGEKSDWEKAEKMLQEISDEGSLKARRVEGEAAIYGPKLDFMFKDSLGREWQLATIQIDFAMPKRFGITYTDKDGTEKTPVMLHRAILGSYERFMAILIEHFNGAFPTWLSPTQVALIPISDKQLEYAQKVQKELKIYFEKQGYDLRQILFDQNETMQEKIRNAQMQKIPYMLVVGGREEEAGTVAVRARSGENLGVMKIEEFAKRLAEEINEKK